MNASSGWNNLMERGGGKPAYWAYLVNTRHIRVRRMYVMEDVGKNESRHKLREKMEKWIPILLLNITPLLSSFFQSDFFPNPLHSATLFPQLTQNILTRHVWTLSHPSTSRRKTCKGLSTLIATHTCLIAFVKLFPRRRRYESRVWNSCPFLLARSGFSVKSLPKLCPDYKGRKEKKTCKVYFSGWKS